MGCWLSFPPSQVVFSWMNFYFSTGARSMSFFFFPYRCFLACWCLLGSPKKEGWLICFEIGFRTAGWKDPSIAVEDDSPSMPLWGIVSFLVWWFLIRHFSGHICRFSNPLGFAIHTCPVRRGPLSGPQLATPGLPLSLLEWHGFYWIALVNIIFRHSKDGFDPLSRYCWTVNAWPFQKPWRRFALTPQDA